jgi:DNA modification methylase
MGKFILGDCMDLETGLPSYPDNFFDLAIVDPPYGIGKTGLARGDLAKELDVAKTQKKDGIWQRQQAHISMNFSGFLKTR